MNDRLTHIDLFAGIGGFSLASRWAGFRTIAFCEKDEWCQKILAKNFGAVVANTEGRENHGRKSKIMGSKTESGGCINPAADIGRENGCIPLYPDIHTFPGHLYRGATLLTGGFPCQPFSCAGKRAGKEDDRDLWPFMFDVIKDARPTWIIGENVAGFVKMELDRSISDLESEGYSVRTFIIPACAVDAKHRRSRVWIVAYANDTGRGERWGAEPIRAQLNTVKCSGQDVADGQEQRLERPDATGATCAEGRIAECCQWPVEPGLGVLSDGLPPRLAGWCKWPEEPAEVPRVAVGVQDRVNKLKGLGNAIVPQVAYEIINALARVEREGKGIHNGNR